MPTHSWTIPPKRGKFVSIFLFFFIFSLLLLFVFQTNLGSTIRGPIENTFRPLQQVTYSFYGDAKAESNSEVDKLRSENQSLRIALAKQQELEREIKALHDQFATTSISSRTLLPAHIVGIKSFIPGFSLPAEIILDQGEREGVRVGQMVLSRDIIIGRVTHVSTHASRVELTTKEGFSITAKTSKTGAIGIIKGKGSGVMVLDNVLLSEKLEVNDIVMTKGSVNENGIGSPPDLILGRVISLNKKASELFQSAEVVPLVDVTQLKTVFILSQS